MTDAALMRSPEAADVPKLSTTLSWRDTLKRWSLRWSIGRSSSRVDPGLYRIGDPGPDSPVLVTCNYRMTVDLMRRDLASENVWLLVLETYGINVWCAAGKGTFGTDELVRRIYAVHLADYVAHEKIVLPQLGAPGVAAHTVRELTGFRPIWGPVRSRDLHEFISAGMKATPERRAVTFTFAERLALAPVEFVGALRWLWIAVVPIVLAVLGFAIGARAFRPLAALLALFPSVLALVLAALAGGVVVPVLLPWLPGRAFSVKGAVAGVLVAVAGLVALPGMLGGMSPWAWAAVVLGVGALASYVGVNFTGATPYTSPSGVERELRAAIPWQAAALVASLVCWTIAWTVVGGRMP